MFEETTTTTTIGKIRGILIIINTKTQLGFRRDQMVVTLFYFEMYKCMGGKRLGFGTKQ